MEKRYQVFVSSTYIDLKEERQYVTQALMEMDCIPAGMELFPAVDEEQFQFIKNIIDDCDYYLLIIGGRYGTITSEGISYTEKEYDYAVSKGLRVVAFIHGNPDEIPLGKSEKDPSARKKLEDFKTKVSKDRLVKSWNTASELAGLVALSLSKTIKMYPAIGWVRANKVANEDILSELNDARKENNVLKKKLQELEVTSKPQFNDLANLDDIFTINGTCYTVRTKYSESYKTNWEATPSWMSIFSGISSYLLSHPADPVVKDKLTKFIVSTNKISGHSHSMNDQSFETIKIQLKAYGLVDISYQKTTSGSMALFWTLTPSGEELMMKIKTIRTTA